MRRLSDRDAWRSFDHLESSGDVGIWHETYLVAAGRYESVYNNMPPTGLGAVAKLVPAAGRKAAAASRVGVREVAYPADAASDKIEL